MRLFGLIGKTLTHSFSQKYFSEKFEREGLADCCFELFPLNSIVELPALIDEHPNLEGLSVTIPYKQQVMSFLSESQVPAEMSACNCIRIVKGQLIGYNTDWVGFEKSLRPLLEPRHRAALILGSGGASLAVQQVLRKNGIPFSIVGRQKKEGIDLTYEELTPSDLQSHTLLINATPLGTFPHVAECPPIPYEALGPQHLLYDLVYNPALTSFLKKGFERGARIKNGEEMLQLQAEESWRIWNQEINC